jgi:trehalose 6-phosphate phosphatase
MTEEAHAGTALGRHAASLAEQADIVAMCLDFDGTLAPIVDDPEQARPLPGMVDLLGPLAARFAAVALLSGRPAGYLFEHAAAPGVRYLGLYGLQEIRDGQVWVDPVLEAFQPAVVLAWPGRSTEPPGKSPTGTGWRSSRESWSGSFGPAVRSDKGHAVRRVMAESGAHAVVVAGDDLGDLWAIVEPNASPST